MKTVFPAHYRITKYKNILIKDFLDIWEQTKHTPHSIWTRHLRQHENLEATEIYSILQAYTTSTLEDKLTWKDTNFAYSFANLYAILNNGNNISFRWAFIWTLRVPPKIKLFIWKLINNVLPTGLFLASRIPNFRHATYCRHCNEQEEDITHIFHDCIHAKHCWSFVDKWWMKLDICTISNDWLYQIFRVADSTSYKDHWQSTISATLWTLWLHRNESIFKNSSYTDKQTQYLIMYRSYQWCTSSGLLQNSSKSDWFDNPTHTVNTIQLNFLNHLRNSRDYFGFTDGSWKITNGVIKAGIGGYLEKNTGDICFLYSGNTIATNPLQAETNSLVFLLQQIVKKINYGMNVVVFTDSKELWSRIHKYRAGHIDCVQFAEGVELNLYNHINVEYVERKHSLGADYLAKQGASKPSVIMGCFI